MIFNDPFLTRSAVLDTDQGFMGIGRSTHLTFWLSHGLWTPDADYDMIYDGNNDNPIRTVKRSLSPHEFMEAAVHKVHLPHNADSPVNFNELHDDEEMLWNALYDVCGKFCK